MGCLNTTELLLNVTMNMCIAIILPIMYRLSSRLSIHVVVLLVVAAGVFLLMIF